MNPEKWKSVVITIESYNVLKAMSRREDRTISGQFTHLLKQLTKEPNETPKPRAERRA
tara:strand:- start:358 stop:531 length:174 start_codon:yes stop_codon:yes gene_type:complete